MSIDNFLKAALGYKLLLIAGIVFITVWVLGWIVLLIFMLLEMLFPKSKSKIEMILDIGANILGPIQKYSFIIIVVLFLILLLAEVLFK